jgi:hypothetical protein
MSSVAGDDGPRRLADLRSAKGRGGAEIVVSV